MWPFKRKKEVVRYLFSPKADITAYELAIIIKPNMRVIMPENSSLSDDEKEIIMRHLKVINE